MTKIPRVVNHQGDIGTSFVPVTSGRNRLHCPGGVNQGLLAGLGRVSGWMGLTVTEAGCGSG
jgi:hypothetical protein